MELTDAQFLTSPEGLNLLALAAELAGETCPTHTALTRLRAQASPEEARAAWELAMLRRHAAAKFASDANRLFFDRAGLEMASPATIARYHASRFVKAGARHILDLGGGVGADTLAFARAGLFVTLYELDPARALFAKANAAALGLSDRISVICGDMTAAALPKADAAYLDPARREINAHGAAHSGGRRWANSLEEIEPPLSFVRELQARGIAAIGTKLSPAVPHEVVGDYEGELEFISERGECKEGLLTLGALRTGDPIAAVLLGEREGELKIDRLAGDPIVACPVGLPQGRYLYEPDPAVIRAHLVGLLAEQLGAWQFEPTIAYLLSDTLQATAFADAFEIQESLPYNRKAVQEALRQRGIGRVVVKKRGFPLAPEEVLRDLRLAGDREGILILARYRTRHWAFIASRVDPGR